MEVAVEDADAKTGEVALNPPALELELGFELLDGDGASRLRQTKSDLRDEARHLVRERVGALLRPGLPRRGLRARG
jgi:hypothetical protein